MNWLLIAGSISALVSVATFVGWNKRTWVKKYAPLIFLAALCLIGFGLLSKPTAGPGITQSAEAPGGSIIQVAGDMHNYTQPVGIAVQQPEFIEGTRFTSKRLQDIFPFGHVVFFFGQNEILTHQVYKNGLMDWTFDVGEVSIEPDFYSRTVKWKIPNVNTSGGQVSIDKGSITIKGPLQVGCTYRAGVLLPNKPVMHLMTIGDNQRKPVFVIGYRMPVEGEGRPPGPPYFIIQP